MGGEKWPHSELLRRWVHRAGLKGWPESKGFRWRSKDCTFTEQLVDAGVRGDILGNGRSQRSGRRSQLGLGTKDSGPTAEYLPSG